MSTIKKIGLNDIFKIFSNQNENEILELSKTNNLENIIKDGGNLLHFSVGNNNFIATKLLLENGFDSNCMDDNNCLSSIHIAAINGNSEITKILIEYGANVNQVDDENLSALHYAYKNNNKNVINILLENNANERIKDIDGKVPSDYYIKNQNNKEEETKNIDNKVVIVDKNKLNINVFIKENIESIGNRIYIVGYHDQNYNLNEKKLNIYCFSINFY